VVIRVYILKGVFVCIVNQVLLKLLGINGCSNEDNVFPLAQKEAKPRPMIAMTTTEHAGGTAWLPPRNCVANTPASVELCIPVHNDNVRFVLSSSLRKRGKNQPEAHESNRASDFNLVLFFS
jgi:hypothetical protein